MAVPIAANMLLRFVLKAKWNGLQDIINVFHYRVDFIDATTPSNNTLIMAAQALWEFIGPPIKNVTWIGMSFNSMEAYIVDPATWQLTNGEVYSIPSAERLGAVNEQALPPFVTWTFKYVRPDFSYRHGWKRFSGVTENKTFSGNAESVFLTTLNALAAALADEVGIFTGTPDLDAGQMTPVIVQSQDGSQAVRPVRFARPASVVYNNVGTQNSRKYNVGS